jgi:hypothetical protein
MELFRISVKSTKAWDRTTKNYYAMAENKDAAIKYVATQLRDGFVVHKAYYLGYEMGGRLYAGGKRSI